MSGDRYSGPNVMRLAVLILFLAQLLHAADDQVCAICGRKLEGMYYRMTDLTTGTPVAICRDCAKLSSTCFVCGLPVLPGGTRLEDGRYLCPRDSQAAVRSTATARTICENLLPAMNRQFGRHLVFPTTNVVVAIVNQFILQGLMESSGSDRSCRSVFGATITEHSADGKFIHAVNLLSDLPPLRLEAVCAHEYAHAWLNEHLSAERRKSLAPDAIEGFCELIAYETMATRNAPAELRVIQTNNYTHGQIEVFLTTVRNFGLNAVVDWMLNGVDPQLDANNLNLVRRTRDQAVGRNLGPPRYQMAATPPAVPARAELMLNGISGGPDHRLALINDHTFAPQESAAVHVGQQTLQIRCLEIRSNAVVIRIEATGHERQLMLGDRK